MKKSDYAMIILVAGFSILVSYYIVKSIPVFSKANQAQEVSTFEEISPELEPVDTTVFNKEAINPTVEVIIGDDN